MCVMSRLFVRERFVNGARTLFVNCVLVTPSRFLYFCGIGLCEISSNCIKGRTSHLGSTWYHYYYSYYYYYYFYYYYYCYCD